MVALPHPRRPRFLADVETRPTTKLAFTEEPPSESATMPLETKAPAFTSFPPPSSSPTPPLVEAVSTPVFSAPAVEPIAKPVVAPLPVVVFPEEKLEALFSAIKQLRLMSEKLAEQARSDALELAFQIAKKILESEIRTSPEPLFKIIRSAINRIGEARTITIRLSPEDASLFELEDGAQKIGARLAQINVVADSSLERGDCILDSDLGAVDGRLQSRLAELRRSVESALQGDAA